MKRRLLAAALAAALALVLLPGAALGAERPGFYEDVTEGAWYGPAVRTLYDLEVLPGGQTFGPARAVTRLEYVRYLYRLHLALGGGEWEETGRPPYVDVPADRGEGYRAVMWAGSRDIVNGVGGYAFDPDGLLTREQCCALLCRFAAAEGICLTKKGEDGLFRDSVRVSGYARSAVAACKMAGLVTGYTDGTVVPGAHMLRSEAVTLLARLYDASRAAPGAAVSLGAGAYDSLYAKYDHKFGEPIPENDPVDASWFDDAVFIGDSVTVRLEMYCASTKALGKATFLCATSLSAPNAMAAVTSKSLHPKYNGVKQKLETSVAACGAKNVYIMLGANNMRSSIANSTQSLVTLIGKIKEKSPNVNIFIESVTPMTANSSVAADNINNYKIEQYNARMREICAEKGWYYVDVASQFKDTYGHLNVAYCSDPKGMGMHLTSKGAAIWVDYLKRHVPESMRGETLPDAPERYEEPPAPEEEWEMPEETPAVSLEAVSAAMQAGMDVTEPLTLDQFALEELYGLEGDWVKQYAGFIVMSGVFPDEIVLVEAVDEEAAQRVAEALEYRLSDVINAARDYDEEGYEDALNCRVVTDGLFVRLILSRDQAEYAALYDAAMAAEGE